MPTENETTSEMDKEEVETTQQQEGLTLEQLQAALKAAEKRITTLNHESAERRKKLEGYEQAEQERANANKSELERATARASELEKRLAELTETQRKQTLRHAVEMTAAKLGFTDPEDAYTLADLRDAEVDETGKVKGVEQALKNLLEKKPYLKGLAARSPDIDAGKRNTASGTAASAELVAQKRSEYSGI